MPASPTPTGDLPPPGDQQAPKEILECKICLAPLAERHCEALLCGHTFHSDCIDAFVRNTGRSRENGCSFKCQLREATVESEARRNSLITAANEAAMRSADSTPDTQVLRYSCSGYTALMSAAWSYSSSTWINSTATNIAGCTFRKTCEEVL